MYHMGVVRLCVQTIELPIDVKHSLEQRNHLGNLIDFMKMLLEEHQTLQQKLLNHDHELWQVELFAQYQMLHALLQKLLAKGSK